MLLGAFDREPRQSCRASLLQKIPCDEFAKLFRRAEAASRLRVAIAYGVVAWLLIQVATQVFPFFELSNFVVRVVVAASVLGFPVALIIAWAFEMTPEGLKRDDDVAPDDYIPRWRTRKFAALVVSVAILAAGVPLVHVLRKKPAFLSRSTRLQRSLKSRSQSCRCLTKAVIPVTSIFRMGYRKN